MPVAHFGLKEHFRDGGQAVAGWCSIPSTLTAEIVARQGFDVVAVDLQHGLLDYQTALAMLQVIDGQAVPTLCRVPWNEPGIIGKVLDAGFGGVICPMINTRDEAEQFARACRYTPRGSRSYGPTRALHVHGSSYATIANDSVLAFAMIETSEALANLDAILAVPDIDGVYVGPSDLGLSLGFAPTLLPTDSMVLDAIAEIRDRTNAAGKIAGIHCGSAEMVKQSLANGFQMATLLTDARMFSAIVADQIGAVRGTRSQAIQGQY